MAYWQTNSVRKYFFEYITLTTIFWLPPKVKNHTWKALNRAFARSLLIFFLLVTMSCTENKFQKETKTPISETITEDDYKIINSTLVHLVLMPLPNTIREFGYHNFDWKDRQIPDQLIRELFFTKYLVSYES
jgi:hypothetical protein